MLELIDVCFSIDGKTILDNINLKLDSDKFYCITGPNGSGKSSLTKIIMGIYLPTSGKILYNGVDITNFSIDDRAKMGISYSFQTPVKFKGLNVYDLISLSSDKYITRSEAISLLASVGLSEDYLNREVNDSLSGGELKRIEIASVFARNSILNIFDEPEAGIDLWSFNSLIELFESMRKNKKNSTIIISHQERILNIADKIILMKNGKIEKIGNKKDFKDIINFNNKGDSYE